MIQQKKKFSEYWDSRLLKIFLSDRNNLLWIFVASSIANLLMLTPMLYMLQIFDRIFISKSVLTLVTVSGIIVFFYIISALSSFIRSQIVIAMGIKIEEKVNERLFLVGFKDRLKKDVKNPTSYLDDLTLVRQWLTGAAVFTVFDLPWVPLYVLVMFVMHPILGYAAIILILILIGFGLYFSKILGNQDEILRQEEFETNDFLYGKLRNSEVLSVYALASNFKEKWIQNKRRFYIKLNKTQKKSDVVQNVIKQYRFFSNSLALTIGAFLVIYGDLTLGSMIAASLLMARTTAPVDGAVATLSRVGVAREAFWRIEGMLDNSVMKVDNVMQKQPDNTLENKLVRLEKGIELIDVSVSFQGGKKKFFKNLNITFKKGELVAVVGKSGVGKTTLIKLLAGLLEYEGLIKLDGRPMQEILSNASEKYLGYLPQDVLLLPGSVAENIAGLRDPDSKRVVEVAKLVGIHDFILKFPSGYDTLLAGGHQNLSGGERQRLGLARAIYHEPAGLFLDEPNSALDQSGELALKKVIEQCRNDGMLILLVTHRRSVLSYSDKILELSDEEGRGLKLFSRDEYAGNFTSKDDFDRKFTL
ncbi:MAG: hypothetical protein CMK54_00480 [Proteobacteria bacterium]|nr:hypothetical protein [Pseudomonadota bacterium]